ncbi:MAG: TlpA disulfide reductase family protein [bacterium]|nr:TlpA disulfide reductase family protein [bacterium]
MKTRILKTSFVLILSAALIASCGGDTESKSEAKTEATPKTVAQKAAPAQNQGTSIAAYDTNGELHNLDEWIGKQPVVMNFWGTWCPPCRREIPELVKLYDEYNARGIEIVSVALRDTPDKVNNYTDQAGMKWVMLLGDQNIAGQYRITGVPTTFFYDKDGNLATVRDQNGQMVDRFVGPRSYETFKAAFESIL